MAFFESGFFTSHSISLYNKKIKRECIKKTIGSKEKKKGWRMDEMKKGGE